MGNSWSTLTLICPHEIYAKINIPMTEFRGAFPELVCVLNRTYKTMSSNISQQNTLIKGVYMHMRKKKEYVCVGGIERMIWREEKRARWQNTANPSGRAQGV